MKNQSVTCNRFAYCFVISLVITSVYGCASNTTRPVAYQVKSATTTSNPATTSKPAGGNAQVAQAAPANAQAVNSQGYQLNNPQYAGQSPVCTTSSFFAQVDPNQGQPSLRVGDRPSSVFLTSAASRSDTVNGTTYTSLRSGTTATVTFDANSDTCRIRLVDINNAVIADQLGSQSNNGNIGGNNQASAQQYQDGYQRGYNQGYQEGRNAKLYNSGYNPERVFQQGSQSGNASYDRGFQDGFYRGFDDGYYAAVNEPRPTPRPNPGRPALW